MAGRLRHKVEIRVKHRSRAQRAKPSLIEMTGYLNDEAGAEMFRLVNERVRLGILSALAVNASMSFAELKQTLGVTDGNLSVHARKLEEATFIRCEKSFKDRRPLTQYALTSKGREAFERYLGHMEALIEVMRKSG
jgi:DNA-binding MarR family transcriptional regulator